MFWYHPDPHQEPLWEIPQFDEYFTDEWHALEPAEWIVRCPWQDLAENGPDYVHLRTVHGAATVPELEELRFDGYFTSLRARVDFDTPRGPQPGRIDTDSYGPGFSVARFSGIVDTMFFNVTVPIDWENTRSVKLYRAKDRRVGEAQVRNLKTQMAQDNVIFDNKIQVPAPALADGDGPIMEFRRWASQFYVDGDPVAAGRVGRAAAQ
jgi:3-ketosteroid 9alpha-monooxygenase subunit A